MSEQTPGVEQRLAGELDPQRHRAPSEGVPQDLPGDDDGDAGSPGEHDGGGGAAAAD